MGAKYLIDTNAVINFSENKLPSKAKTFIASIIDDEPVFSIINKIELLGFSAVPDLIVELLDSGIVIELSEQVANKTIELRKSHRLKLPDAIIAATAIEYDITLVTRNIDDFKKVKNLKIQNPWDL